MYGVHVNGSASSSDTGNQLFLWGSSGTTSAIGFKANAGTFGNPTGNGDGYNTYLTMDTSGRGWVFRETNGSWGLNYTSGWILNNGIWQANASMRAPTFYDSNDTGYYLNPNSTSNVSAMISYSYQGNGNVGGTGSASWHPSGIYSAGFNWLYGGINAGGSSVTNMGDARANIYYDYNDTAYYVDPNSVSRLNNLLVNVGAVSNDNAGLRNVMPTGGSYVTSASSVAGAIVITLPVTQYPMIKFRVSVYTYDGLSFDIYCGGHNSSGYWYNTFAYMGTQNRAPLNVRFTYGSGLMYVYIGEIGQSWNYPQVFVTDVQVGYASYEYTNWDNGWTIGFNSSTYNNVSSTHVVNPPPQSSSNSNALYGSIFYDANDTAYYTDPNSTSRLNRVDFTNLYYAGDTSYGFLGSSVYVDTVNSGFAGDQLELCYYRGSYTTTSGSMRAPLFYDRDNTSYYADPASTSQFSTVNLNGTLSTGDVINIGGSQIGSVATSLFRGIELHSAGNRDYYIGKPAGAWTQPLHVYFYTGVRLVANPNYDYGTSIWHTDGTIQFSVGQGDNNTRIKYIGFADSSFRAPIFYDSNDTGYYLDPNSTSVLNRISTVRTDNWLYIDSNYGHSVVGVYSSYRYQGVFAMGDSYKLSADGTTLGTLYGLAWSHPNAGGAAGNLTDHGLLVINNGSFRCAISNSIVASGSITAYSDERLKTNWRNMPKDYVNRLAQVKVGIYDRTDQEDVTQVGVSAQSFQNLLPEAIMTAKDDMQTLSVNYGGAALASTVELAKEVVNLKELSTKQQTQIEDQSSEISELKSLINMLVDKVNKLVD